MSKPMSGLLRNLLADYAHAVKHNTPAGAASVRRACVRHGATDAQLRAAERAK